MPVLSMAVAMVNLPLARFAQKEDTAYLSVQSHTCSFKDDNLAQQLGRRGDVICYQNDRHFLKCDKVQIVALYWNNHLFSFTWTRIGLPHNNYYAITNDFALAHVKYIPIIHMDITVTLTD